MLVKSSQAPATPSPNFSHCGEKHQWGRSFDSSKQSSRSTDNSIKFGHLELYVMGFLHSVYHPAWLHWICIALWTTTSSWKFLLAATFAVPLTFAWTASTNRRIHPRSHACMLILSKQAGPGLSQMKLCVVAMRDLIFPQLESYLCSLFPTIR
jgi:hypothetical protein